MKSKYFYGYNIVAVGAIIQGICYGSMFTFGVFFKELQAEFGWSRAMISGASALAFLIMGPIGILAGRLNDRIGPRILILISGSSLALGYMLMSRLNSPWQLYVLYGIMISIGFGSHDVITMSTGARWFVKRRGMMSGILKAGAGLGQLVLPLTVTALIGAYGWRNSYIIMGGAFLVIILAVAQVFRRDPQEMGLFPDGETVDLSDMGKGSVDESLSTREAIRTRQFWILFLAEFISFFCMLTVVVHIVPHVRDLGFSPITAGSVISVIGGLSILGRIVMGTANDRIGGKISLIICFVLLTCGFLWLQVAVKVWMLLFFAVIYGLSHGGFMTVISPMVAETFGTRSHGALFGIILFSGSLGAFIGPLLAGRVFDVTGTYRVVFFMLAIAAGIGIGLIAMLRPINKNEG